MSMLLISSDEKGSMTNEHGGQQGVQNREEHVSILAVQ